MKKMKLKKTNYLTIQEKRYVIFTDYKENWFIEDLETNTIRKAISQKKNHALITCGLCDIELTPYEKKHLEEKNEAICLNCFYWFKDEMKKAKFQINEKERY
jgi:uncharacterized CHY-type Zn-finger protein